MNEIWKSIDGFDSLYYIKNNGDILSCVKSKQKILKQNVGTNGYKYLNLYKDKKSYKKMIHRLVALTFIENNKSKLEVNHINGIKTDNRASNLEWVSPKENIAHAINVLKINTKRPNFGSKNGRSKKVINTISGQIFDCAKYAANSIGISESYLSQMLNGSHKNVTTLVYMTTGELSEIEKIIKSVKK